MIIGIGHDLVEIERIEKLLCQRYGDVFMRRVLTEAEYNMAQERKGRIAEFVAGRFSAKEAVVKALGCGIGLKAGFQDVEIIPNESGKPECTITTEAFQRLGIQPGSVRIHVSITHNDTIASAYVVVERV